MNKLFASALFILMTAASLVSKPTIGPNKPATFGTSLYVTNANQLRLAVEKSGLQPLQVTLRPAGKNQVLFTETIGRKKTGAAFQFDVNELPAGAYELEVKAKNGDSVVKQITLGETAPAGTAQRQLILQ